MLGTDGTPNRDGVRLGRIIRDRRGALNMTQPELAERAGVSPAIDQTRLAELLEELVATRAGAPLPPSVEEVATAEAVSRFLRETRA